MDSKTGGLIAGFPARGNFTDPMQVQLVERIREKTVEKKLVWTRDKSSISCIVDRLKMTFLLAPSPVFSDFVDWAQFAVTYNDVEVLSVAGASDVLTIVGAAGAPTRQTVKDPVQEEVQSLFELIRDKAKGDLRKALEALDQL